VLESGVRVGGAVEPVELDDVLVSDTPDPEFAPFEFDDEAMEPDEDDLS
jgi:hypothetical protein